MYVCMHVCTCSHDQMMVSPILQAQNSGLGNSVCTLYELHSGDDASEEGTCNGVSKDLFLQDIVKQNLFVKPTHVCMSHMMY